MKDLTDHQSILECHHQGFAPCAQADMSRLLNPLVILLKRAASRCSTRWGCRSGSTDAHHRSSELVAARMTSKKSGSQEGKSCWGARAAGSRPALSKPSHAAYSVSQCWSILEYNVTQGITIRVKQKYNATHSTCGHNLKHGLCTP